MHHQFNIQQLYALPTLYLCVLYLRTNSDLCQLIGFYNRYEKCLLRGMDWGFKQSSLRFVFKGLNIHNDAIRSVIPSDSAEWLVAETTAAGAS
jgi:hypothetical protein